MGPPSRSHTPPSVKSSNTNSQTPLHESLGALALSHGTAGMGNLQDEDLSFAAGSGEDDSFDVVPPTTYTAATASSAPRSSMRTNVMDDNGDATERISSRPNFENMGGEEEEGRSTTITYGGSMGILPSETHFSSIHTSKTPSTGTGAENANSGLPRAGAGSADGPPVTGVTNEEDEVDLEGLTPEEVKRATALKEERDGLRAMNNYLEHILEGLTGAEGKMDAFQGTIGTTHELLDLYVRLSSQAEHTQQLLLDGQWEGVTKDIELLEARAAEESRLAQEAQQRKKKEASVLAEAAAAKTAQNTEAHKGSSVRGSRGRGTGTRGLPRQSVAAGLSGIGRGGPPPSGLTRGTVTGVRGVRGIRSRASLRGAAAPSRGLSSS